MIFVRVTSARLTGTAVIVQSGLPKSCAVPQLTRKLYRPDACRFTIYQTTQTSSRNPALCVCPCNSLHPLTARPSKHGKGDRAADSARCFQNSIFSPRLEERRLVGIGGRLDPLRVLLWSFSRRQGPAPFCPTPALAWSSGTSPRPLACLVASPALGEAGRARRARRPPFI